MKEGRQIKIVQVSIYMLIWTLLLLFPLISNNRNDEMMWNRVFGDWIRFAPFIAIFLIHHFALLPILIKKKKRALYLASALGLILIISVIAPNIRFLNDIVQDLGPPRLEPQGPPLDHMGDGPPRQHPSGQGSRLPGPLQPAMFYNFLVSIMLVGFDAAITIAGDWFKQERRAKEIENSQIQTELAFLRNQVSPHFFMNTLNNIHALIEDDQEKAQDAVIRLSKLMRYLLYETGDVVPIAREMEFISSYFDLMRIRYDEKVKIDLDIPSLLPQKKVHPLLAISFIENAFKHGVSYQHDSFVRVSVEIVGNEIEFRISNSIQEGALVEPHGRAALRGLHETTPEDPSTGSHETRPGDPSTGRHGRASLRENSGIGQNNVIKQLTTLYNDRFSLDIRKENNSYFVYLKIPLSDD